MSRTRVWAEFVLSALITTALLLGAATTVWADQNGGLCNRQMHCVNWYKPPGQPWVCRDIVGLPTYPTDGGCYGTTCAPCQESTCTIDTHGGKACECRDGYPAAAKCKTCLVLNGGNVVIWGCIDSGCTPIYDCEFDFPAAGGSAAVRCKCK